MLAAHLSNPDASLAGSLSRPASDDEGFELERGRPISAGERALRRSPVDAVAAGVPSDASGGFHARLGGSRSRRLDFHLVDAAPAPRTDSQGEIVYAEIQPATDLIVRSTTTAMQLLYLLRDASAPRAFHWSVDASKDAFRARSGAARSLELFDAKGTTQLRLPAGVAYDASGKRFDVLPSWDEARREVEWRVIGEPSAYPVLVDPVIESARFTQVSATPSGRENAVMAYDSVRERIVLFGGSDTAEDTWEWDGVTWRNMSPDAAGPPDSSAMTYDVARRRTVLLGIDSTWEWDGASWTERVPVGSGPPPRFDAGLVYDPARQQSVLFGGWHGSTVYGDTWLWDGTTWVQTTSSTMPPARFNHGMAYDPGRQRIVLYGGMDAGSSQLGDTWEWLGNTWNNRTAGAGTPPKLADHALVYDQNRQQVVMFGGYGDASPSTLWTWNGLIWSGSAPTTSPAPRTKAPMAFDAARRTVVLFGGQLSGTAGLPKSRETWTLDADGWEDVSGPDASPGFTSGPMVWDAARGEVVLLTAGTQARTWVWNGSTWMDRTPPSGSPTARTEHALAYDAARQRVVLFGGNAGGDVGDTWTWDGTSWTLLTPAGSKPTARRRHAMTYDAARQQVVLFGGLAGSTRCADTWVWNGTSWAEVTPAAGNPLGRMDPAMTYDAVRDEVVLFGGAGAGGNLGDTWIWNGASWIERTPPQSPLAGFKHTLVFDSTAGRTVYFAEPAYTGNYLWTWDGERWSELNPSVMPGYKTILFGAAFDAARGQSVFYRAGETWTLELGLARSSTCSDEASCLSGHCVDGVCCASECGGGVSDDCQACSIAAGADADGICSPVSSSVAHVCREAANICDATEVCDGVSLTCPEDAPLDIAACVDTGTVRERPRTSYCATSPGPGAPSQLLVTVLAALALASRRRRASRRHMPLVLVVLLSVVPFTRVLAQPATPRDSFDVMIQDGISAFSAGRFDDARRLFRRAHELNPNARTLRGIGMASFDLADYVTAYVTLTASLDDARRPLTSEMRTQVMQLRANALARVARVEVVIDPPDATLLADGVTPTIVDGNVILNPGGHNITAHAPGFTNSAEAIHVESGGAYRVRLTLTPEAEPTVEPVVSVTEAPSSRRPRLFRPLGITLTAAGGGLAIGGFVTGAVMLARQDERLDSYCGTSGLPDDVCTNDPVVADVEHDARRARILGLTSLGVGVGVAAAGATLWILASGRDTNSRAVILMPTLECASTSCAGGLVGAF